MQTWTRSLGRDKGGYYHELFLRGKRFLTHEIDVVKSKGTHRGPRKPNTSKLLPDMYAMSLPATSDPKNLQETNLSPTRQTHIPAYLDFANLQLFPVRNLLLGSADMHERQQEVLHRLAVAPVNAGQVNEFEGLMPRLEPRITAHPQLPSSYTSTNKKTSSFRDLVIGFPAMQCQQQQARLFVPVEQFSAAQMQNLLETLALHQHSASTMQGLQKFFD
jgi:hypothetical protein